MAIDPCRKEPITRRRLLGVIASFALRHSSSNIARWSGGTPLNPFEIFKY